ncbi:glycine--tRNA ligase [Actinoalloteichus hoggarensis]|uniref:Multifunctional fusion protein n=2 Tax=Actinoalloteichus hoggarensis TaxID=1470176 RepID=A0A221W543_9PSEU|nr:glycine--tRNA ligase [Actinoalloteichus hoggarensis]ASO21030.1 Glycine--tRNA ligase alpha subunit [Actinoalloteichus hoggarensis]
MLTMQDAILALTKYWTDQGCMVVQPLNTEVGAGTLNPATVLRVLGPEPWRTAYVEPSVRPDDSRYGENPNRLQTHTQFQVILKPDPGDPQELYLGSLAAIGIDVEAHDVRFVEDNWDFPALGAWGLGWEVWLDGLEITQFTYFQQAGGATLDPISVEITYGLERILMALQNVSHFKDIAFAPGISYGEAFGQAEYEMSRYYLDDADVAMNRRLFDEYANEARRLLDARLPMPAHYYVLKCSHTFNVLDARGAVSTTERAKAFGRTRALTRDVVRLWAERREELGHPLGVAEALPAATVPDELPSVSEPATLLFEVGTEELPAAEVRRAAEAMRTALTEKLAATRLGHGRISTYATPRRIVAVVEAVEPGEPDAERTVRGPRVANAFDAAGAPTKAAAGFARGQGVDVADLGRAVIDGVEFVVAVKTDVGRGAVTVLSELLSSVVLELRADKNMRWNDSTLSYSRPVRWLLAMLGDVGVPVAASSLLSGVTTRVHRTAATPTVGVPHAEGYVDFLASHGIVVDIDVRRGQIVGAAQRLVSEVGGTVDFDGEAVLLEEIVNLVEQPTPILGSFSEHYLELPDEILTTVMRKHQRYLPVRDAAGALMPYFVAVANGACDHDAVRAGNEGVLRARYEDAAFFWRADLAVKPETMKLGLERLAFEERLGSMADRTERIAAVARELGDAAVAAPEGVQSSGDRLVPLSGEERQTLDRAAQLVKFDLGSQMVVELTSLAGTMAREYALRAGESPSVAAALYDMEQPRSAGGTLPATVPGALLSLADRLDLLVGLFGVGASPTGSSDPFGLRRAALGLISVLRSFPQLRQVTVSRALRIAADVLATQGIEVTDSALAEAHEFVVRRYEQQLLDAGHQHAVVAAVLPLADSPITADETLAEVNRRTADPTFVELAAALQRVRRIVPDDAPATYDAAHITEPAEVALRTAWERVEASLGGTTPDLARFVEEAAPIVAPIAAFFDDVLVMAEDAQVRAARLGLLASIRDAAAPVLDWRALGTALSKD